MTSKSSDARPGRGRRIRTIGSILAAALAAPLALASVAATPAAAAPADGLPLIVSGDAAARNTLAPGLWTWEGDDFTELKALIDATSVNGVSFDIGAPIASPTYPGTLSNVDVYFSSAVGGNLASGFGYTAAEEDALSRWIRDGGVLIANTNSREFDVTRFLGRINNYRDNYVYPNFVEVDAPRAFFEGNHDCAANGGVSCPGPEAAPNPSPVVNSGIGAGVGSIRNWHTVTAFDENTLPAGAEVIARITSVCTETQVSCAEQAPVPPPGPGDPPWNQSYNNNLGTGRAVVAFVDYGDNTTRFGEGAVVLTSDTDTFSNAYAGGLTGGNRILAQNIFNHIAAANEGLVAPPPPAPGSAADATGLYNPVTPSRVFDTRTGTGVAVGKIRGGQSRSVQIHNVAGVPADATAVALNLTATNQEGASFLTVYPTGGGKPTTSNLNIPAGNRDVANAVAVRIGDGGRITISNENNAADVIVDVVGYWSPTASGRLTALTNAQRILDTRAGQPVGEGQVRTVPVLNVAGAPAGATGVIANVTATDGTRGGFLTVFPEGTAPDTSSVNFQANANVPNLVFAPIGSDGSIRIRNALGETDVIVDVLGYFSPSGTTRLAPVTPARILDTRATGKVGPDGVAAFNVRGAGGVDASAQAVLMNVTVNEPGAAGFLTAFPGTEGEPDASNVNFAPGQTVANLVLARIGTDGTVRIANNSPQSSHVLADVFAWFGPGV